MRVKSFNVFAVFYAILFFAAWWFMALIVKPEIHSFLQQPSFLTTYTFLKTYLAYPGGIADYLGEFVSQFFVYNLLGSFLIVSVAAVLGLLARQIVAPVAGKSAVLFGISALMMVGCVLVQLNYHYPYYVSVRLLLTFLSIWAVAGLIRRLPKVAELAVFLSAVLLFYVAGGAALFVFVASVAVLKIRFLPRKTDWVFIPFLAMMVAVVPFLAYRYFFLIDQSLAFSIAHSETPKIIAYQPDYLLYGLYAILPVSALLLAGYYGLRNKLASGAKATPKKDQIRHSLKEIGFYGVQTFVVVLFAAFMVKMGYNQEEKNKHLVSLYAADANWDKVIETAKKLPDYDIFVNVEYNRALAAKDQLAANLFSYPQLAGTSGLFVDVSVTSDVPLLNSDQYYDLGFMNESQHWTFEAQSIFPESPRVMKRLVLINLVKGNFQLANKFWTHLDNNLLSRSWAAEYRKYLTDTALVAKTEAFSFKRKCDPKDDFTSANCLLKLEKLYEANPSNKMAFAYLQSYFLLEGNLKDFMDYLLTNHQLKYPLPRAWDEAVLLYYYSLGKTPEVRISAETKARFSKFVNAMKPFGNDWRSAREALKSEFGATYWYYLKCLSPKVTNAQIKKEKFDEQDR